MKKLFPLACIVGISIWGCGPEKKTDVDEHYVNRDAFEFSVVEDAGFKNLPALQSFVLGVNNANWIMFGGRTNGFHSFPPLESTNFPSKKANDSIFVYVPGVDSLYSMAIPSFGGDTGNVFLSTNLAHTEQADLLYACGGYGVAQAGDSVATKTYAYFMQMNMPQAISAVKKNNPAAFKRAIVWGNSPLVQSTGGELYRMPNGNFYMCVGHNFSGMYTDTINQRQQYLNQVNVFSVSTANNALTLTSQGTISDGLPNETTQFHRRDLVVAPAIQANGTDVGISIYGGVFTYGAGAPFNAGGIPFSQPIYINPNGPAPYYTLDTSHQYANIYSAAFLCMYNSKSQCMSTSIFGGLGQGFADFSNASWTKYITTARRSYANKGDVTTYQTYTNNAVLPEYMGSESIFIPASGVPFYNQAYGILDYAALPMEQVVGYIYGGIISSDGNGDKTWPSPKVYKVTLQKLLSTETK
ncbi:MAG: hypothetical protein ACRCYO_19360 [Bacteroidia bacterium]